MTRSIDMPPIRSRDPVNLRLYLRERSRHPFANRDWPWGLIAPLGLVGIAAMSVLLAEELPIWMTVLFVPLAIGIFVSAAIKISWGLQQPRNEQEQKLMRGFENAKALAKASFAHQIHPVAERLLEGCAYQRARVLAAVEKPGWEMAHMRRVRDQAVAAANEGMDEAIATCMDFSGPGFSRSAAWKDLAHEVAEGQLGDALKRLQSMLEADRPGDIVDRRKLPTELWPAYDIAVKLQKLAMEVESARRSAADPVPTQSNSLDQVLADLSAIKQAERELAADPPQQHLGQG